MEIQYLVPLPSEKEFEDFISKDRKLLEYKSMEKKLISGYASLLSEIKGRVRTAQYEALKAVNKELISLYWDIGRMITERQKGETWGKSIIERLAKDLQLEFPGIKGFSTQNLWYMRQFYQIYGRNKKLQPLVGEISWAKHLHVMSKCTDDSEREFYIRMTSKFGWTKNVLALNIEAGTYTKYLNNQTNFEKTVLEKIRNQAKLAVKDEYTFDFHAILKKNSRLPNKWRFCLREQRRMGGNNQWTP